MAKKELSDLIKELEKNPIYAMSLSSKELFHSNFLSWLLTFEQYSDYITNLKNFFSIEDGDEIFYVFREKYNFDLLIVYGKFEPKLTKKIKSVFSYNESVVLDKDKDDDEDEDQDCFTDTKFSEEEINLVKENIKFVVVENKLKAIPTKEQLEEYTNKIEAEKSIFSIKKTDNENAWIKINPNNSKKIILAPKLSLNGFSVDGWNEKTYEDYLEALKQIKDQINEKDSYILEKYIEMLENICGIFEKIENDLENPGIIPNKDNVEKLRKIRLDDLYTKIWYSGIKNKINGKISLDGKIKSTTGFTRGTGLLDWKYTPAGCNFIVGLQIQHLNFRITLEPEKGYKYNLNDNEKEVFFGNIQKWEEDILKKLENDVNINSYFVKWNYDLHKYGDFKYIQAEINENIKLEDITKVVNITLRYINDSISNLIIDERKIVKSN